MDLWINSSINIQSHNFFGSSSFCWREGSEYQYIYVKNGISFQIDQSIQMDQSSLSDVVNRNGKENSSNSKKS